MNTGPVFEQLLKKPTKNIVVVFGFPWVGHQAKTLDCDIILYAATKIDKSTKR